MTKNAFSFVLKTLFVLKIFQFSPWLFGHAEKAVWLEIKVQFKFSVTAWLTKNYNTHIAQYLKKQRQPDCEILSVNRI